MSKKNRLYFIRLTYEYLMYLKKIETRISEKIKRPLIGIVLEVDNKKYFAPLSSPKEKHKLMKENLDIVKIKKGELGIINLNNMIPVIDDKKYRTVIDLNILKKSKSEKERKYFRLLQEQLNYCEKNREFIERKAEKIYEISQKDYKELTKTEKKILSRSNNFKILEKAIEKII
ncbi:type III toxin-antitoxin system ToxN/AbiQ family toxin [Pseudoleptotrichia goodfellowii]|uniref:Type III toxin-antitoxin system ToxN/AbiQ family toxin n=2 Tax=Pseudoleptotrichia goodfellowii TaxID=157692 RepID=D0GID0_9FUSO|nr:type III toxin-antitoxin system ToxN/AbiQ family toxin [Pseudoleptotrichia goodfellowii]EEY36135.1 hypothetical protein HMPREF0554_1558 [Pseudoleptotrichia goodfellowii F0264]BBM35578.1 hypothetical protein JCM16774_0503 [Pseudoleptotrichia goodfellowii]